MARGGRRGGAASRGQGGPGVTAGEEEKSAFPISSPLFPPPPRFFSLLEALGCESHFLSSRQNGPRVSGGGGVRVGKEAAAGTGFLFHPGSLLPAASAGGRGEESGVGPRRGALGDGCPPARPGPVLGACLPAGLPLPRRLTRKHRRGAAAGPGRVLPACGRPAAQPGVVSCGARAAGGAEEETDSGGTYFGRQCAGPMPFAPPEPPRMRDLAVGGGSGWKVLRWRWAWLVARAGGAVAPRAPSSLAARAAPFGCRAGPGAVRSRPGGATLWVRKAAHGAGAALPSSGPA